MDWFTGIVTYLLLWWVALFCVLPIGARPRDTEVEEGGWRGAPANPRLGLKVAGTTVLAGVFWLGAWALMSTEVISFRDGWWAYGGPEQSSPIPGVAPSRAQN